MLLKALVNISMVFISCCLNVIFLESIIRYDPGAGNLITLAQFSFVSVYGLFFTSKFFIIKRVIKLKDYAILVAIFFVSNVCNNYALKFKIPMPLLLIFRSGSLIANMIMSRMILKRRYTFWKYFSVFMITIGIGICTLMSRMDAKESDDDESSVFWWTIGVILMAISLLLAARMGIFQETLFRKYGKHPEEALFYSHLLALPTLMPLVFDIFSHYGKMLQSSVINLLSLSVPSQLLLLALNVVTHFLCIRSVYVLTSEFSSLTVTLVVTLRKFVSLILSIVYFKNPFTTFHWIGTIFIFIGTLIFTEIIPKIREKLNKKRTKFISII